MDIISQEALQQLETLLNGYLPPVTEGGVVRELLITPKRIKPSGIGGYIGHHNSPAGDVQGRFIHAQAEITVSRNGNDLAPVNTTIKEITASLLTNDQADLRSDGIFGLRLKKLYRPDVNGSVSRVALFNIEYEYLKEPEDTQGIISEILLKDILNPSDGKAEFISNMLFEDLSDAEEPMEQFESITDPNINNSSPNADWEYDEDQGRIEQTNNTRGGGLTTNNPKKAGAQLLIQPGTNPLAIKNGIFTFEFNSNDRDGMGCVFRWIDSGNYYYFLLSERHDYQLFGKKVNGNFSFLETDGLYVGAGLDFSDRHECQVIVLDDHMQAYVDGVLVSEGRDTGITTSGQFGLLTHGNNSGFFYSVDIVSFGR